MTLAFRAYFQSCSLVQITFWLWCAEFVIGLLYDLLGIAVFQQGLLSSDLKLWDISKCLKDGACSFNCTDVLYVEPSLQRCQRFAQDGKSQMKCVAVSLFSFYGFIG